MNIALFGGTFDPIHAGHLQAAKAAARRLELDRVLFIPTGTPPHKYGDRLTPFVDRYAMVALACAADRRFVPSLLEQPAADGRPHYSVVTAQKARRKFGHGARLYFLVGADAFLDLPHWKDYGRLLDLLDFIVVSRPGFESERIWKVVPEDMVRGRAGRDMLRLRRTVVRIIHGVDVPVASREIREAVHRGRPIKGLVPPLVEQYLVKAGLYRSPRRR